MTEDEEKRLQAIEDRANAATEEPWEAIECDCEVLLTSHNQTEEIARLNDSPKYRDGPDGNFIAHSREDIPWLIERLREAGKPSLETILQNVDILELAKIGHFNHKEARACCTKIWDILRQDREEYSVRGGGRGVCKND